MTVVQNMQECECGVFVDLGGCRGVDEIPRGTDIGVWDIEGVV